MNSDLKYAGGCSKIAGQKQETSRAIILPFSAERPVVIRTESGNGGRRQTVSQCGEVHRKSSNVGVMLAREEKELGPFRICAISFIVVP